MKRKIYLSIVPVICFISVFAQTASNITEPQIDYLEKIYFSGGNKQQLTITMLQTKQQLEKLDSTSRTVSVLKQFDFLRNIETSASHAENACDVLELLAAGMYSIDATTAQADGVKMPDEKAKANAEEALKSLNGISDALSHGSASLSGVATTNYWLTGSTSGFATAGKVAGISNAVNGGTGMLSSGAEAVSAAKKLTKMFGNSDKPCKSVQKKDVTIGVHKAVLTAPAPGVANNNSANAGTVLTVKNISYAQLTTLASAIQKIHGVTKVTEGAFSGKAASLTVTHSLEFPVLLTSITREATGLKLEIEGADPVQNTGTLVLK